MYWDYPEFDMKHLKKAKRYIGRDILNIAIKNSLNTLNNKNYFFKVQTDTQEPEIA